MWKIFANTILRNRIVILFIISAFTVFMTYNARNIELDYNYAALLPKTDSNYIEFQKFKQLFGEDANISIIGIKDKSFFELNKFNDWQKLQADLDKIKGIENVLSISSTIDINKNLSTKKFEIKNIFPDKVKTQTELDSLSRVFKSRPFYDGLIYNDSTNTILMAVTMNKDIINSKAREVMIAKFETLANKFGEKYNLKIHYSGLPYTRTKMALLISSELYMFIFLAMLITATILFLFFRSFKVVMFAMLIVGFGVIWSLGTIALLGYKITILTGMIPPLIIVIGIPNSVYLLNKYHSEYKIHSNKIKALYRVIRKVGNATFLTNLTTALGFATFIITRNRFLVEFGIVASLNIIGVFILSITLIPIFFSYLAPPKERHIKHLDYKYINKFIERLVCYVNNKRKLVYIIVVSVTLISIYGTTLIKTEGFIVDDIPHDDPIYVDLKFLEDNIGGVMPLEITIDTKKKKGVYQYKTLKKMNKFINTLKKYDDLSKSTSIIEALKFSRQAYFYGKEISYKMPSKQEMTFIMPYLPEKKSNSNFNVLESFIDSTGSVARISYRLKDIGTIKNKEIAKKIIIEANKIFSDKKYKVTITGSSIIFSQGTGYLVKNLLTSLTLAIILIAFFMATMFISLRMILISLLPNFLPLLFTAAIMGYFHIPIKPSTILVFSIAFGIAVDNAIHFLTKYRQELFFAGGNIQTATIIALRETGVSIIYTAGILFFGFGIFTVSKFGGTQALGLLVSITLLIAMLSNLILLPSLLLSLKHSTTKTFKNSFDKNEEELQNNESSDINC